jgi:hypothetical protein
MPALLRREVLDGMVHPKFQAELPERLRSEVTVKVALALAGAGNYAPITLADAAVEVRAAAQRLKSKPRVPKQLAAVLGELSRVAGY